MQNKKIYSRRRFINSMGLLGAVSVFPLPVFSRPEVLNETSIDGIMKCEPYLQASNPNEIEVRWITHTHCYGYVEYGEGPENLDQKAQHIKNGLVQANNTIQNITLKNLEPGKTYYYRVISRLIADFDPYDLSFGETEVSRTFSFSTPSQKKEGIEFLVLNDIHERPESYAVLAPYAGDTEKDFIFLNGDMFNWMVDENQIVEKLLHPLNKFFATSGTPFIFGRGNHETRGKFARQVSEYFDGREHEFYYSFQQGPAYFIVLDSGEDKLDDHPEYAGLVSFDDYRVEQKAWLEKEIRKEEFRNAKYKIVFSHIPLFHAGDKHGTLHCRNIWGPLLNEGGIDLLISGHTHRHGVHPVEEGKHNYPIVIGGGKKDGSRTIMRIKADQKELDLQMVDDNGNLVGSLVI